MLLLPGTFACASTGMEITITGTPSHAAYPDAGRNPARIIAKMILAAGKYAGTVSKGLGLVTVIGADIGSCAYGVTAGKGVLRLTVRAEFESEFRKLIQTITDDAMSLADSEGMSAVVRLMETFPATENHTDCVLKADKAAHAAGLSTITPGEPFRWSEDFGYYLQRIPGALLGIGAGVDHPQLHTESYEFPDTIIPAVLELYHQLLNMS